METIKIQEVPELKLWRVVEDYNYISAKYDIVVFIPKGELLDGNSVPWYMRWRFPKCKIGTMTASAIHDILCKYNINSIYIKSPSKYIKQSKVTRDVANLIYKEILDITTNENTEYWMYSGVELYRRWSNLWTS